MTLKDRVVDIETAKELDEKLREAGVEVDNIFQWERHNAKGIGGAWFWKEWTINMTIPLTGIDEFNISEIKHGYYTYSDGKIYFFEGGNKYNKIATYIKYG